MPAERSCPARRPGTRPVAPTRPVPLPLVAPEVPAYVGTGATLGWAVLAYLGCVVLVITLQPFTFAWPTAVTVSFWVPDSPWGGWFDVVTNVAMFLPLGFVGALTRAATTSGRGGALLWAAAAGGAASAAIELAQCFEVERYPSPTDVVANAAGAWLGAWVCRRLATHLGADTPLVGRLALELPVVGLAYVSLPLLMLAGLTAGGSPATADARALALIALAGFGGALLGTVQRRHLGPSGTGSPVGMATLAGIWFAAGAWPAALTAPHGFGAGIAVAAASAWLVGHRARTGVRGIERRFESEALGRAAPWLAAYLALVVVGDAAPVPWSRLSILRDLEHAAGFTVLGYLLGEAWGRREWRYRRAGWRVAGVAGVIAGALGVVAWQAAVADTGAAVAGALVRTVAAAYGGWVYHLQRAHVRALVAARRSSPAAVGHASRRAA